ncbi:MAG TPA: hypothetical protein VJO36_06940 [Actinomycetota bacterium]|nr:hypothetical protein [Actinomycetota bacterium]
MTDLRERFGALDALEVPDVMARARKIGPKPPQPEPPPRSQRIGVLVLVAVIAIAAIVLGARALREPVATPATTGPDIPDDADRVGFIGLPPEGATPSAPERGELVLSFVGRSIAAGQIYKVHLYADGRLITWAESDPPEGANPGSFLEQRLTPEGVELVRSEIVSTGLFGRDLALVNDHSRWWFWGTIAVREGDRLVSVEWTTPYYGEDLPGRAEATPAQANALERIDAQLADPSAWLPTSAWEDREIRAYVPSRYEVCFGPWPNASVGPADEPSRILTVLPAPAADLLRAQDWTPEGVSGSDQSCSDLTTDEARSFVEALSDAGIAPDPRPDWRLEYRLAEVEIGGVAIWFEPYLPHGEVTCSACG